MSQLYFLSQLELPTKWTGWPFNSGYGGDWQTSLATYGFSALILVLICVFLRLLYGPGGIWRDKELEREAEEARQQALDELQASLQAGMITEAEYTRKKRALDQ